MSKVSQDSQNVRQDVPKPSKPIIPAIIGMFTYGSSSPYALVLCIEHYLRPVHPIPWSTHIATVLAAIGTAGWFALNLVFCPQVFSWLAGNTVAYAEIGLMMGCATIVFFIWSMWRVALFLRDEENVNKQ
ncbi:MAG: hypothetical protein SFV81_30685 [Pirellulaceae bacterium]|nr:hypothetical protein [Pirellulaceae bacterium]